MCDFACGGRGMLHSMSLLHRSVIHYQVTFELHFWSCFKASIIVLLVYMLADAIVTLQ